jgi:uncharacterized protein YeaO (DUF488 family)
MLKTKCVLAPISEDDGIRVSVMSGLTLEDGITPHPDADKMQYQYWLKALAPSRALLGDYYKRGLSWDGYEERYNQYLSLPDKSYEIDELAKLALTHTVTILCLDESPEKCHRRLIAERCKQQHPELEIQIQ